MTICRSAALEESPYIVGSSYLLSQAGLFYHLVLQSSTDCCMLAVIFFYRCSKSRKREKKFLEHYSGQESSISSKGECWVSAQFFPVLLPLNEINIGWDCFS